MFQRQRSRSGRRAGRLLIGALTAAGVTGSVALASGISAEAATIDAVFANGVLTVRGNARANAITITRNAAGRILVNGGAIPVSGGTPTVANTSSITVAGRGRNDAITLDEASGALPRATLSGGPGNDTLIGGSGADRLTGQGGTDTLLGKGGSDLLFGGTANDTLTGGDADDQVFGQGGKDRMIWNPGDDTDLNEGGVDVDTVEVNGGNGTEAFTATANGTRVRFDRLDPAPFAIDVGSSENLVLNANGGNDSFSATGDLATLIGITTDGGAGNDTLLGSNGIDLMLGGDGDDFVDGQQGNDHAFLGAGSDTFQWDPGDGSDVIEGQADTDTMLFNGSGGSELFEASANGQRLRFTRSLGTIVMDTNDVEAVDVNAMGGPDTITVNDLSGTDVVELDGDLAGSIGGTTGDAQPDTVVVNGTNGDDVALVAGNASGVTVVGLAAQVSIANAEAANDRLTVNALAGDDVVDASALAAGALQLTADGGDGDDVLIGSDGNDVLLGGPGDDVLVGGPGTDTIDGGDGDDVEIQSFGADRVTSAAPLTLSRAELSRLIRNATAS